MVGPLAGYVTYNGKTENGFIAGSAAASGFKNNYLILGISSINVSIRRSCYDVLTILNLVSLPSDGSSHLLR